MSPAARSLHALRKAGYSAAVVERWNAHVGIRQDLFGWIDVVAVHPLQQGVLGVQTTTAAHMGERIKKARGNTALRNWLAAGNRLLVHGWTKRCRRRADGTRSKQVAWELRETLLQALDLEPEVPQPPQAPSEPPERTGAEQAQFDPEESA